MAAINYRITVLAAAVTLLGAGASALGLGVESSSDPDAATVKSYMNKTGFSKWESLTFWAVDGQKVSGLRAQDTAYTTLRLKPGDHDIAVWYLSPRGFLRGFWSVDIVLRATLKPDGHYGLGCSRDGDKVRAWIEDLDAHVKFSRIIGTSGHIVAKGELPNPDASSATQ
jgi:hypothetical protein